MFEQIDGETGIKKDKLLQVAKVVPDIFHMKTIVTC